MARGKKGRESGLRAVPLERKDANDFVARSEERRVGKECGS